MAASSAKRARKINFQEDEIIVISVTTPCFFPKILAFLLPPWNLGNKIKKKVKSRLFPVPLHFAY